MNSIHVFRRGLVAVVTAALVVCSAAHADTRNLKVARQQAAAATSQVASVAPATAMSAAVAPRMPRVGDRWTYQIHGWKKAALATLTYRVTDVSSAEIVESLEVDGVEKGLLRSGKQPRLNQRKIDELGIVEFSPHLGAFGVLDGKERWDSIEYNGVSFDLHPAAWQLKGGVVGREPVTVPAGRFDAIKVEITGNRDSRGTLRIPATQVRHTIWYAPAIKRIVRQEMLSKNEAYDDRDRIICELTKYSVASGR